MKTITKVLNNNAVIAKEGRKSETVIIGTGIGYKKKAGDKVEEEKAHKTFHLEDKNALGKFENLLKNVDVEYIEIAAQIINEAQNGYKKKLQKSVLISLSEHIYYAVLRHNENIPLSNALLLEISKFYPKEFEIGQYGLELIRDKIGISLKEDDAAFIALHLINGQLGADISDISAITALISKVIAIVEEFYSIKLDPKSHYYTRFITHVKYFGQRLLMSEPIKSDGDDDTAISIMQSQYPKAFECVGKIEEYIKSEFRHALQLNEQLYFALHIIQLAVKKEKS